ncbi:MAG: trypsin-like peptidase domain-containing protein [Gammaproteobacteria bacterium]
MLWLRFADPAQHVAQPAASGADAVRHASPAVVNIYTSKVVRRPYVPLFDDPVFQQFFRRSAPPQRERIQRSLGSGVIMSIDGYLLTNNHVISGADEILVLLEDGRESIARVVGTDPETDLAVLRIELPDLQPIAVGDPAGAEVGDVVLAIGNPYGFEQSVSQGIVSALGRYGLQLTAYDNFIQTDAAINPGNSGGALVDADDRLIGINTAIYSRSGGSQGIGLAIPADFALKVLQDIVRHGTVVRGWLGVSVAAMPARIELGGEQRLGLVVSEVETGSPADRSGLEAGDLLIAINGEPSSQGRGAMQRISLMAPGDRFSLEVIRGDRRIVLEGEVGQRPAR